MNYPYIIKEGISKDNRNTRKNINYTFIIFEAVIINIPGLKEEIRESQGVKIYEDGYVECKHIQKAHHKSKELYKSLKILSIEDRLKYVERLKTSLQEIKKFNI